MSQTLEITVGDTGITISGTITHPRLRQLANTSGMSVTVSCRRIDVREDLFTDQTGTIGTLDATAGTLTVSYRLVAGDVDTPGSGRIKWKLTFSDGSTIRAPGPLDVQTILQINADE
jgi:hypothetical protein